MTTKRTGTVYLQVAAGKYWSDLRVLKATQRKPRVLAEDGAVVVKIRLVMPNGAFEPLEPEAVVEVPDSFVQTEIQAEVEDANE